MNTGLTIFLWLIGGGMAVMSLVLLSGRGSGLIAGYNTASTEKKRRYDEKRLCKTVGTGLAVTTVAYLIGILFECQFPHPILIYVWVAFLILPSIVILILAETVCKRKQ